MFLPIANGQDFSSVRKCREEVIVKSIGNSTITPRKPENVEDVRKDFYVLAESVAARLHEQGLKYRYGSLN